MQIHTNLLIIIALEIRLGASLGHRKIRKALIVSTIRAFIFSGSRGASFIDTAIWSFGILHSVPTVGSCVLYVTGLT